MIRYYHCKGMFWFRVQGYGLHVKNTEIYPLLFSERYGGVKVWRAGKWAVKFLRK